MGILEEVREASKLSWQQASDAAYGTFAGKRLPARDADQHLVRIEQRNKFSVGDTIEIMRPDCKDVSVRVNAMYDEKGSPVESCPHSKQTIWLELSAPARQYDLLRMEN